MCDHDWNIGPGLVHHDDAEDPQKPVFDRISEQIQENCGGLNLFYIAVKITARGTVYPDGSFDETISIRIYVQSLSPLCLSQITAAIKNNGNILNWKPVPGGLCGNEQYEDDARNNISKEFRAIKGELKLNNAGKRNVSSH